MKISTNWLRDFIVIKPPVEALAERLTMAGLEVKKIMPSRDGKDVIFEIEITTNRPDWLSHIGVAREIAAIDHLSLKLPEFEKGASRPMAPGWRVNLRDLEACPYYTAVYIEGVTQVPTPEFIKDRLEACGHRSINLIVDITNYVLLETGQPLHAFDADLLRGKEIQVRKARAEENFSAIDGTAMKLTSKDLVIADEDRAIALAGVMGGKDSEISERTRNILLESAFFQPRSVRQTSQRYRMMSDSSYRFERRVDPEGVDLGRECAIELIRKYAKPRFVGGAIKAGQAPAGFRGRIHLTAAEVQKRLGMEIKPSQIALLLGYLGLDVKPESKDGFSIGVPSFRSDLTRPVDLVEEVARLHGYDKIPETLPDFKPGEPSEQSLTQFEEKARAFFTGMGACETVTFSLISENGLDPVTDLKGVVQIVNPMHKELRWLRPTLCPSLLSVVQKNLHSGCRGASFYEIANVYSQPSHQAHPQEASTLGVIMFGDVRQKNWMDPGRAVTFYDLKGAIQSFLDFSGISGVAYQPLKKSYLDPVVSESLTIESEVVGSIGKVSEALLRTWDLDCDVYFAEISLEKAMRSVRWQKPLQELPKYPAVDRDLSVMVRDSVKVREIVDEIASRGKGLIREVRVFDLFRGGRVPKGFKNIALRVLYQSAERTLVSEEIQALHSEIGQAVVAKFEASFQTENNK
jgi:phenylalanyl-tRNA synthetase beta chain